MQVCHNCNDKFLAENEVADIKSLLDPNGTPALDIGCGDSGDGERILAGFKYTGIDIVDGIDAKRLPYRDGEFTVVLMKRILCQHGEQTRRAIVAEANRVCQISGTIIICEPWAKEYGNLNKLRVQSGLTVLPQPASGGNLMTDLEMIGHIRTHDQPINSPYIYWTRFMYELLTGKMLAYDDNARLAYPIINSATETFNPYRTKFYAKR